MTKFSVLSAFLCLFTTCNTTFSQVTISGEINDTSGTLISSALVLLKPINVSVISNDKGFFEIKSVNQGIYQLVVTHIGLKTYSETIEVKDKNLSYSLILEDDPLNLQNIVVTGNFEPRLQLESSTAITTIGSKDIQENFPRGTAALLQAIPGTFVDAAAGEVFTRVYSRGISASAEDDMGWYYTSLQEDGLPVSLVQHSYYSPDLFHRVDITAKKLEAIRGGSASVTSLNGPGGIYNFISQEPTDSFSGKVQIQGGFQGEGNPTSRIDAIWGGPLGNNWSFNVGGHYRRDDGARNTPFIFSKGGQIKFNLVKKYSNGFIKFYGKILDDFTNRYTGVAATNWDNPEAAFGQNFNSTALLMPSFSSNIPDGRRLDEGATNKFDPSQGVHAQDRAFGVNILQNLGKDWTLRFNLKHSHKNANWQTSISNAFVSLNNPLAYFISGAQFPIGEVVFRDTATGSEVARLNNSGILAGESFEYTGEGSLPNDGIMGTASWLKQTSADEWFNQTTLHKKINNHNLSFGLSGGLSNTSLYTQGSFGFVTYEPNPRMLQVTLENTGQPVIALSDENGLSNYGGLFFDDSRAKVSQFAFFANDRWQITEPLYFDLGLRYETINHSGNKDRSTPFQQEGGADGDPLTDYDNSLLVPTGETDDFDFTYDYLSYSTALNYKFSNKVSLFTRFSKGNKAPELNYYFNNFSNVPINRKGEIQKITQFELGLKYNRINFSSTTTLFLSKLKNVAIADFAFDQDSNSIFYTPVQFNNSRTIGIEFENAYTPFSFITFTLNGALQHGKATKWTVYNANNSINTDDDIVLDFSDNKLPFNPNIMFNLGMEYYKKKVNAFVRWQFMGEREGNISNAFQLASYSIFDTGFGYAITSQIRLDLLTTNIFNSKGLANFFGENSFGANANGVTNDFITANPDTSFVVVPVLPRGLLLKVGYEF
ncbi:TonB-dependent receptor [Costertonia aggregata]|uniref:TonB-dependent receptor n=1 Tax=Costertonia aggregata TaxID=343403 RepID=A0A7H9ARA6_9FLAO|nr:TonB-dependent receptor [Costertonia aggregata]QLG45946.1 TonB-dependent receptor [Costertonia aggregata]